MTLAVAPLALAVSLAVTGCGARTGLLSEGATGSDGGPVADTCPSWIATSPPVQVSNIPSIVEVLSVLAVPGGVLVGYGDAQFPPVDPTWHLRTVGFGAGTLGPEQTVFSRNTSQLGWSAIYAATNGGSMLATASDETDGMFTGPIDATGAATGAAVTTPGNQGQFLAAADGGFSVLRSPWDDTGAIPPPVSLASLSTTGAVLGEQLILAADPAIQDFGRVVRDDGSFLLWWYRMDTAGDSFLGESFDATGNALGSAVPLRTLQPMDYGGLTLAASTSTMLGVWPAQMASGTTLTAQAYDAAGAAKGAPVDWGTYSGQNLPFMALTGAPGGDYLVGWVDQSETSGGNLYVQSVASDGTAEGPVTMLGPVPASPDTNLFVVATTEGAMVLYEADTGDAIQAFAIPLRCGG